MSKQGIRLQRDVACRLVESCGSQSASDDDNDADKLRAFCLLGRDLDHQGLYIKAERLQRRVFKGTEKVLGREHPNTLTCVSQLGSVLESQGKYDEAEAMRRRALDEYEKVLGLDHPLTLASVYHLAFLSHRKQHYSAAVGLY